MTFAMGSNAFNFKDIYVENPSVISLRDIAKTCTIIGVARGEDEFYFNPDMYSFAVQEKDIIVVFGKLSSINRLNRFLNGNSLWHKF